MLYTDQILMLKNWSCFLLNILLHSLNYQYKRNGLERYCTEFYHLHLVLRQKKT